MTNAAPILAQAGDRVNAKQSTPVDFGGEERPEAFGLRLPIKAGLFGVANHVYTRFWSILPVGGRLPEELARNLARQALALSAPSKRPTMGVWKAS